MVKDKIVSKEGYIDVPNGKIWYEKVGKEGLTPIICLSGEAGYPHYYLRGLSELSDNYQIIFYDQIGCGKSSKPTTKPLWSLNYYLAELELLVEYLDFDKFHIFSHSWSTILAIEFALKHTSKVASLIFEGACFSIPRLVEDAWNFRRTMPKNIQEELSDYEMLGHVDWINYEKLVFECYKQCICRLEIWPQELINTLEGINLEASQAVSGINVFLATGNMSEYDCTNRLREINCPTLLTHGYYDIVSQTTAKYYQSLIPNSTLVTFNHSSHLPHLEEKNSYLEILKNFLLTYKI